jgi:hypothetical protein
VEPYRRVPALPHNGARQRILFLLFLFFLPFALPIRAALPLLARPNDIVIFLTYEEKKDVPGHDDALRKQRRHQQRSVALALASLLFQPS